MSIVAFINAGYILIFSDTDTIIFNKNENGCSKPAAVLKLQGSVQAVH